MLATGDHTGSPLRSLARLCLTAYGVARDVSRHVSIGLCANRAYALLRAAIGVANTRAGAVIISL